MIEVQERAGAWHIPLLVRAGAGSDRVIGEHDGRLKVEVKAPPEKGKANQAVEALVADRLGVRKSAVSIVAGMTSRKKTVRIEGIRRNILEKFLQGHAED